MIFSRDVLFIHVPKTAGISVTDYLLRVLPKPLYVTRRVLDQRGTMPGIIELPGREHETLVEARDILRQHGLEILEIPLILAVLRNPYSIKLSRYKYIQQDEHYKQLQHEPPALASQRELAKTVDFETFVLQAREGMGIRNYYFLDGEIPPNLQILRFEHLGQDLETALRRVGINQEVNLPHWNKTFHSDFQLFYTQAAEEAVYQDYRWVFDSGLYPRMDAAHWVSQVAALRQELQDVKNELRTLWNTYSGERDRLIGEYQRLEAEAKGIETWAHELEATVKEQEATLRVYRRALAPIRPLVHWAQGLKRQLAVRPPGSGKGN